MADPKRIVKKSKEIKRDPTSNFAKYVSNLDPVETSLPFTHITDGYRFREIVENGKPTPKHCHVFEKPLLYFFFGRPAYRVNQEVSSSSIQAYAPICFLIDPVFDIAISNIYPFDTGAFHKKMLDRAFHEEMKKEDFALSSKPDMPHRLIRLFFGTMDNYYKNKPLKDVAIPPMEFEVHSYHSLIIDEGKNNYDERISAIEIQIDQVFPLGQAVLAIIVPDSFMDDPAIFRFAKRMGAELLPYDYIARLRPEQYTSELYSIVKSYYIRKGLLT